MKDSSSSYNQYAFNIKLLMKKHARSLWKLTRAFLVSVLVVMLTTESVLANDSSGIAPSRCVSLREGQPCFVKLRLHWDHATVRRVCLYKEKNELVACWEGGLGKATFPQSINASTVYSLKNTLGDELINVEVQVSWVYRKKRSRRRWRLF